MLSFLEHKSNNERYILIKSFVFFKLFSGIVNFNDIVTFCVLCSYSSKTTNYLNVYRFVSSQCYDFGSVIGSFRKSGFLLNELNSNEPYTLIFEESCKYNCVKCYVFVHFSFSVKCNMYREVNWKPNPDEWQAKWPHFVI